MLYAKKYYTVLKEGSANELLLLSEDKRKHVMKALAVLSKFIGMYDFWKALREQYQLKWSNGDSLKVFQTIFNEENNFNAMMNWLKEACSKLPKPCANILLFDTLTGLRPNEALHSIDLIKKDEQQYLNKNRSILEHFKFSEIFLRRTKNAYISVVTEQILDLAKLSGDYSYNGLKTMINRQGLQMQMGYCRKIFSTYLRTNGIESEIIDLLQGRVPKSVFGRHYFRPTLNFEKVRSLIESLDEILQT
jgi:intergrase/recombinase